jgi:hypothetical protein
MITSSVIRIDPARFSRSGLQMLTQRRFVRMVNHLQADLTRGASNGADNWRVVIA